MELIGLVIELIFLALAVYLYLFARGRVKAKDAALQKKAEAFRRDNAGWLRILSLALMAIMAVNIVLHIMQLLSNK